MMTVTAEQGEKMKSVLFNRVVDQNTDYAVRRKFAYKKITKKVTLEVLSAEIAMARILGELSGAERILQAIVDNKDWDREMIEAELHFFVESLAEIGSVYLEGKKTIGLEDILKMYGYYGKDKEPTEQ